MILPIYTGELNKDIDVKSTSITLHDIIVSADANIPYKLDGNVSSHGTPTTVTDQNIFISGNPAAFVYNLTIEFNKTPELKKLAGFDIYVYRVDPETTNQPPLSHNLRNNPTAVSPASSRGTSPLVTSAGAFPGFPNPVQITVPTPPPKPVYRVRTLVSKLELGYPSLQQAASPSGYVKYFVNRDKTTIISTKALSPQSKLAQNWKQKLNLRRKRASVTSAAYNTTPGLVRTLNSNAVDQKITALSSFLIQNNISLSDLANASSAAILPIDDAIKKSSLGMDWFAPKDNTHVLLSHGRILKRRSLLEERTEAKRVYDNQNSVMVEMLDQAMKGGANNLSGLSMEAAGSPKFFVTSQTDTSKVTRRIEIPRKAISGLNSFYVILKPLKYDETKSKPIMWDSFTRSWQSSVAPFPADIAAPIKIKATHQPDVEDLIRRAEVPISVSVNQQNGKNIITLTCRDPGSNIVRLVRIDCKKLGPKGPYKALGEKYFGTINLSLSGKKSESIIDNDPLPYPIYSRYIILGGGYTQERIVEGKKTPYSQRPSADDIAIVASNSPTQDEGVKIIVSNIPAEYKQVRLLRENMSSIGTSYDRTVIVPGPSGENTVHSPGSTAVFVDKNTHLAKKYRYFVAVRGIIGGETIPNSDALLIRNWPVKTLPFTTVMGTPEISYPNQYQAKINVEIKIETSDFAFGNLLSLMKDQNMAAPFMTEVAKQKNQFSTLICYGIKRVDVLAGTKKFLGLRSPGMFGDVTSPTITLEDKVDIISSAQRFYYELEAYMRPPEAFLAGALSAYTSYQDTNIATRQAISAGFLEEWGYLGVIPSNDDISKIAEGKMSVIEQISKGATGYVVSSEKVSIPPNVPVPSLTGYAVNSGPANSKIVLKYEMNNTAIVDAGVVNVEHTLVMYRGPQQGTDSETGAVLASTGPDGTYFETKMSNLVGEKEYYIVYLVPDAESGKFISSKSNILTFMKESSISHIVKV